MGVLGSTGDHVQEPFDLLMCVRRNLNHTNTDLYAREIMKPLSLKILAFTVSSMHQNTSDACLLPSTLVDTTFALIYNLRAGYL